MERKFWIDLGRCGDDRVGFDFEKESGIGFAGYCGSGKSNITYRILSKMLEQKTPDEIEIHLYNNRETYLLKQFDKYFDHVVEVESKLHKIRSGLNKICKEIDRRKRKLEKNEITFREMQSNIKGTEIDRWKEKYIFVDGLTVNLINLRKLSKDEQYLKHMEYLIKIAEEGPEVGIKPIYVFLRTANSDAPKEIITHLSVLGSFHNPDDDYERWELSIDGLKKPKKTGEMLLKTTDYNGFVKTYNIEQSITSREGIFNKWDPYRDMYLKIMNKLK